MLGRLARNLLRAAPLSRRHDPVEPSCPQRGPHNAHTSLTNELASGHRQQPGPRWLQRRSTCPTNRSPHASTQKVARRTEPNGSNNSCWMSGDAMCPGGNPRPGARRSARRTRSRQRCRPPGRRTDQRWGCRCQAGDPVDPGGRQPEGLRQAAAAVRASVSVAFPGARRRRRWARVLPRAHTTSIASARP